MGIILSIIGAIVIVVLFLLFVGLSLLSFLLGGLANVWRMFRLGGSTYKQYRKQATANAKTQSASSYAQNPAPDGKIFAADEGIYVDFEEVKD
jgi:hypothetical protein